MGFLVNKNINAINETILEKSLADLSRLKNLAHNYNSRTSESDRIMTNFKKNKNELVILFVLLQNFKYSMDNHSAEHFCDFLFTELNKFENSFNSYLKSQQENTEYPTKSQQLLNCLANEERYNLLSFNYTTPGQNGTQCNVIRNIHGKIGNQIIIGIDSASIDPNSIIFRFTKTYRIITLASDRQDKILPTTVKTIVFYGHSLAQADYSYFQSIFDYYNIYDNDITLVFYYSIYNEEKQAEIQRAQFDSVSRLINEYGTTFHNEKGKNLMHKMLLESRLILKQLT
ncbi:AbiH family protein [Lactiplantibacillus plantarum]|uniref:AbiH family protein n=1 Tax=Lactiplantibacillus plantarum TaxID=1590 RepID=UPI0009773F80|nr:AbiH family protein [Lactiplantibacillus plantarum]